MKKVYSLILLLFGALFSFSQPHLRISNISGTPFGPLDTAYEAAIYDSIAITIVNDGTSQFSDFLFVSIASDSTSDSLFVDTANTTILPGDSVTKVRNSYFFSPVYFDDGDNIIVVWPQAIQVPVQSDTLSQHLFYVSMSAGAKNLHRDEFRLYPNPASRYIIMDEGDNISIQCVRIFDQTGRIIYKKEKMEPVIYVGDWSPGIYIIEADTRDGQRIYRKMIKD